jgi:hypothetical protein
MSTTQGTGASHANKLSESGGSAAQYRTFPNPVSAQIDCHQGTGVRALDGAVVRVLRGVLRVMVVALPITLA